MRVDPQTNPSLGPPTEGKMVPTGDWLTALRRYLVAIALGNLAWELAQLPLYTIWYDGSMNEIVFAVLHCTGGDLLIAGAALLSALLIAGDRDWPRARFRTVAAIAILGGLAYTLFSEWLNTEIRGNWAYTELMPQLPLIGAGISPFAQWVIVPLAAFWWVRRPLAGGVRCKRDAPHETEGPQVQ
jgi:hypothetical protein